jgi:tetratricopeptide (TPR) repeat protein
MKSLPFATRTSAIHLALLVAATLPASRPTLAQTPAPAASALHEAIQTAQHGDPARALALTRELLARYPAYGPAFKFEGALLEDAGQNAAAETAYEHALKLTPQDPELLFKVGVNKLLLKDYAAAIDLLQKAARLSPSDPDSLFYLAQAYHLHGEDEPALKAIAQSVQLGPTNAPVLQKYGELLSSAGNNLEAIDWLRKARKLDPTLPRMTFDLAVASFRNQDLDAAADYAGQALQVQPSDVKALELLAQIDVKLARWQEAKDLFTRLLALQPEDPTALLELGHSELGLKDYQAAADTLQRVLQQQPATILAHFYLSRAYAGLGRQADAAHEAELHNQLVQRAGSIVPVEEREIEKKTLVAARQLLAQSHEAEALQLFRERSKGPNATPGQPSMLVGVSYLYMGRPQDAQRCLNQAIAMDPTVHLAHTYLGLLALQQQDFDEAERQFNTELKQDPNSQLAVAELGELRYRQGRWAEAADQLARSRTVDPRLLYLLSDACFHLGNTKQATLTAELAAGYAKDDPAALHQLADLLNRNNQPQLATRILAK